MTNAEFNFESHGKRLSPKTIFYKFSRQAPYLTLYAYFGFVRGDGESWFYLIFALVIGLIAVPSVLLSFFYFKYLITKEELIIHSGVINRKQRNIQLKRIQNVNIQQNFIQRILGISTVKMETAGDASSEAILDSVSTANANEIKEIIKDYQNESEQEEADISVDNLDNNENENELGNYEDLTLSEKLTHSKKQKNESIPLLDMTFWDVTKFGILRFRPILIVMIGWLTSMVQQFMPNEFRRIDKYLEEGLEVFTEGIDSYISTIDSVAVVIYVIIAVIFALLVSWLADIILTIIQYFGFKLSIEGKKLYTSYGLLTKRQGTIPLKKLQMMIMSTNLLRYRLDYWGLHLETAGTAGREGARPEVAIPFAKLNRVLELAKGILPFNMPDEFEQISKKTIRRAFIRYLWLLVVVGAILSLFINEWWAVSFLVPLIIPISIWRWRARSYYLDVDKLLIKEGWFFKKLKIIQISKVQSIIVSSNVFQRGLGLATLNIDTAASSGFNDAAIVDIEIEKAKELSKIISNRFHSLRK